MKGRLILTFLLVFTVCAISVQAAGPPEPPTADVNVVNTPLQIEGDVEVTTTSPLDVNVTNDPLQVQVSNGGVFGKRPITLSISPLMSGGQIHIVQSLPIPECDGGEEFHVQGIQVAPTGDFSGEPWRAEVSNLAMIFTDDTYTPVALAGISDGSTHVETSVLGGLRLNPTSDTIQVAIFLLDGTSVGFPSQWNIHVWGICQTPISIPPLPIPTP